MSNPTMVRPSAIPVESGPHLAPVRAVSSLTLGWLCTFLSILLLLTPGLIGSAGAAGFLLVWICYAAIQPALVIRALPALGILWAFPLLTLLSTFWSEATMLSARASVQYTLTVICVVIAAQATPPRQFISAIMSALIVVAILSLLAGRVSIDHMTGSQVFLGIFASKNYLAFFLSLLLLASTAVVVDRKQPPVMRLLSIVGFIGAIPLLVLTRSATSLVVSIACMGILVVAFMFARMAPKWRALFVIATVAGALYIALVLAGNAEIFEYFITRVLGKDTTLTGRTYLWGKAASLIAQEPILGRGFQAFWRPESLDARALWRYFHITSQGGFHFHNTYVEIRVGLGNVGFVVFVATLLIITGRLLVWYVQSLSVPAAFFITILACIFIRSFVEIDVIYQFQVGTFLLYAIPVYCRPEIRRYE